MLATWPVQWNPLVLPSGISWWVSLWVVSEVVASQELAQVNSSGKFRRVWVKLSADVKNIVIQLTRRDP